MNRTLHFLRPAMAPRLNLVHATRHRHLHARMTVLDPALPSAAGVTLELFVRNLERSRSFYASLGFIATVATERSAELVREGHRLVLVQPERPRWAFTGEPDNTPRTNLRLAVADLGALWARAGCLGLRVLQPLQRQSGGSWAFMVADPDGFGLHFSGPLRPEEVR
ncbi:MAG: VOC family protein [Verrucomicrobia bacterium]|nr:VOC family protein [Verrucomicrobiota bacterium]